MRIIQISDIHIRNFKYRSEYVETFKNLHEQIKLLRPDLVINTGDTVHSKTQISPELVDMLHWHIQEVGQLAPYRIILGNHDLNLKNTDRQDAISPVVNAYRNNFDIDVELWDKNGKQKWQKQHSHKAPFSADRDFDKISFWVFSLKDEVSYPTHADWSQFPDDINIGLFHGAISGCTTDQDWQMNGLEHDLSQFSGLDFVMMGDIHKHQMWDDNRIGYAGSLIQQNFGESPGKGFLLWDIDGKNDFSVKHVPLQTPLRFTTVKINKDYVFSETETVQPGSYVRVISDMSFTSVEQRQIVELTKERYKPKEVFVVSPPRLQAKAGSISTLDTEGNVVEFRSEQAQQKLFSQYLTELEVSDTDTETLLELDRDVIREVAADDDTPMGGSWRINKIGWSNMFLFGEDNIIDFERIRGVYGLFGPNGMGKSSFFEIITESVWDKLVKEVKKNIEIINDDADEAKMVVDFTVDDRDYVIERTISRIKFGQRKKDVREWGKTSLDFYELDADGNRTLLNSESRPDTEKAIRHLVGGFDDFCMTSMTPQITVTGLPGGGDFISSKQTDRKKLLYKFLGLDVFECKFLAAKDRAKDLFAELKILQRDVVDPGVLLNELEPMKVRQLGIDKSTQELVESISNRQQQKSDLLARRKVLTKKVEEHYPFAEGEIELALSQRKKQLFQMEQECEAMTLAIQAIERDLDSWVDPSPVDNPSQELGNIEEEIRSMKLAISKLNDKEKTSTWKLKVLDEVPCGDAFPTCKFLRDAFEAKEGLTTVHQEITSLKAIVTNMEVKRWALLTQQGEWKAYRDALAAGANLSDQLTSATTRRSFANNERFIKQEQITGYTTILERKIEAADDLENIRKIDEVMVSVDRDIKDTNVKLNEISSTARGLAKMVMSLEIRIAEALDRHTKTKELGDRCHMFEVYLAAMGKNGIPRVILSQVLPMLSREINRIVASVADFTVSLDAEEDEQSLDLTITYPGGVTRSIGLAGGAQKFITSLAIRAALARITSLPRSNMFIVDEGFGKLDVDGISAIQRMFHYLKTMFDHVIIVSHHDSLRDMVDGTIDIGRDDTGRSHIEHI